MLNPDANAQYFAPEPEMADELEDVIEMEPPRAGVLPLTAANG